MTFAFAIVALIAIAGAIGAVVFRQIVHAVLCLAITFTGMAMLYLQLGAQFLGFAQFLVYIGAVTILILFAILLTKNTGPSLTVSPFSSGWASGAAVSLMVFGVLVWAIGRTPGLDRAAETIELPTVKSIGLTLMANYVIPLEVIALLLTAAMIGAVVLAMNESSNNVVHPAQADNTKGTA